MRRVRCVDILTGPDELSHLASSGGVGRNLAGSHLISTSLFGRYPGKEG